VCKCWQHWQYIGLYTAHTIHNLNYPGPRRKPAAQSHIVIQRFVGFTQHCTALHCTALHCTALHCPLDDASRMRRGRSIKRVCQKSITPFPPLCTTIQCSAVQCSALQCTFHPSALRYNQSTGHLTHAVMGGQGHVQGVGNPDFIALHCTASLQCIASMHCIIAMHHCYALHQCIALKHIYIVGLPCQIVLKSYNIMCVTDTPAPLLPHFLLD
jgi:hypothetical protein